MSRHYRRIEGFVVVAFIFSVAWAAPLAESQDVVGQMAQEMASSSYRAPAGLTGDVVIAQMLQRNLLRKQQLHQYSAIRTYEIRNLEGKVAAQAVVRVEYEAPDKKTFSRTSEKGSSIVRHLVFDHLIQSESETSSGREHHNSAISTANYTFTLAGEEQVGPYRCFVLEAIPKRKDKYLFEGKIWIDAVDFAVVKIAGHPAKNRPSGSIELILSDNIKD